MIADNPASWFLLCAFGIYFLCRFFNNVISEAERIKAERERACQEIFLENSIDKQNVLSYNRYRNSKGD